jgi:hypothetical protein
MLTFIGSLISALSFQAGVDRERGPVRRSRSPHEGLPASSKRPDASLAEIIAAAKVANEHDFIGAVPFGYDTLVGDRGSTLSAASASASPLPRRRAGQPNSFAG